MPPVKVTMRRSITSELRSIPVLPVSLEVRHAQAKESTALATLLHCAYPTENWEPEATKQELFYDKTVKAPMVVVSENRILATASLQIRSDTPEHGWVRWVATTPDRRREGLAQTLVIRLLAIASDAGCQEVRLGTTTDLTGAIRMYLNLGFEPLVTIKKEQDVWDQLFPQLKKRLHTESDYERQV